MPDIPELEALVAVAEAGSHAAAARRLGVPRSTLVRRLDRLEESLGAVLLDRGTRGVDLTDVGKRVFVRAREVLEDVEALVDDVDVWAGVPRGTLRIVGPSGLGAEMFVEMMQTWRERFPEVRIQTRIMDTTHPLTELSADVVIRQSPLEDTSWIATPLVGADLTVVASPTYLAREGTPKTPEDLQKRDCLAVARSERMLDRWPLYAGGDLRIQPIIATNDVLLLKAAALEGLGLALLPLTTIAAELSAGTLVKVLEDEVGASAKLYALHKSASGRSPKVRNFIAVITELLEGRAGDDGAAIG